MQKELQIQGGQLVDTDVSNLLVIVARKADGVGGMNLLTKVSSLFSHDHQVRIIIVLLYQKRRKLQI